MGPSHYSPVSWEFIRGPTIAPALVQISVADSLAFGQPSGIRLNALGLLRAQTAVVD
jgi:hypothetical protein